VSAGEQHDESQVGHRYFSAEFLAKLAPVPNDILARALT